MKTSRRTVDSDTKNREGEALKRSWVAHHGRWTQAGFATDVLHVSEGYLPQLFTGKRPITVEQARLFAQHLNVPISSFSERLAKLDLEQREQVKWPFRTVQYTEIASLQPWELPLLEGEILSWLARRIPPKRSKRA